MTQAIDDGGSAFPEVSEQYDIDRGAHAVCSVGGMTLRDYFAAKAMQVIRADAEFLLRHDADQVADRAYELADAMLKARATPA